MRLLPISLVFALFTSAVVGAPTEDTSAAVKPREEKAAGSSTDVEDTSTTFNGVQVPPMLDIEGASFKEQIKDGYWFVKHHS